MLFRDRQEAGRLLGVRLQVYQGQDVVILALPRGGVPVGAEIAKALAAPLDIIIPRKIGAPGNSELAIGAVAHDGTVVLNHGLIKALSVTEEYIEAQAAQETREIERRLKEYRGNAPVREVAGKTVIVVDDGMATGYTMLATVRAIRKGKPRRLVLAVPVAPGDTVEEVGREVDEIVVLNIPEVFYAVGQFYRDFAQTSDDEVKSILRKRNPAEGDE